MGMVKNNDLDQRSGEVQWMNQHEPTKKNIHHRGPASSGDINWEETGISEMILAGRCGIPRSKTAKKWPEKQGQKLETWDVR